MAQINILKARQVTALPKGFYKDGACLFLRVSGPTARQWVFRYKRRGRVTQLGLGSVLDRDLAGARVLADKMRKLLADGGDPASLLKRADDREKTFRHYAEEVFALKRKHFRSEKHAKQWPATLHLYAYPKIGHKRPGEVTLADIETILRPIWNAKTETADRVRARIETVLDFAYVAEGVERRNPAIYKGNLEHRGFGPRRKVSPIVHHPAAPYADLPAIMSELREETTTTAFCLRFTILTWARSGEVRGAEWKEINEDERLWMVPAHRMKAKRPHEVPLCDEAMEILREMARRKRKDTDRIFPGARGGLLCDVGINKALHALPTVARLDATATRTFRSNVGPERSEEAHAYGATVHGMRASARSWAEAKTDFRRSVLEMALAHAIKDRTEAAYQRDNVLDKRRRLMQEWGEYCRHATVVPFPRKAVG
jgi:integrase